MIIQKVEFPNMTSYILVSPGGYDFIKDKAMNGVKLFRCPEGQRRNNTLLFFSSYH